MTSRRTDNTNVVPFRGRSARRSIGINSPRSDTAAAFAALTGALIMEKHRRGTLEAGIVEAFLVAVNIPVPR